MCRSLLFCSMENKISSSGEVSWISLYTQERNNINEMHNIHKSWKVYLSIVVNTMNSHDPMWILIASCMSVTEKEAGVVKSRSPPLYMVLWEVYKDVKSHISIYYWLSFCIKVQFCDVGTVRVWSHFILIGGQQFHSYGGVKFLEKIIYTVNILILLIVLEILQQTIPS